MRFFQRAEKAVSEAAAGAGNAVTVAVLAAAAAVVLLVGVLIGARMSRS